MRDIETRALSGAQNRNPEHAERSELLDAGAVCALLGGSRPIHQSTLYRGIRSGRFPKPIKIGPKCSRWFKDECTDFVARCGAARAEAH